MGPRACGLPGQGSEPACAAPPTEQYLPDEPQALPGRLPALGALAQRAQLLSQQEDQPGGPGGGDHSPTPSSSLPGEHERAPGLRGRALFGGSGRVGGGRGLAVTRPPGSRDSGAAPHPEPEQPLPLVGAGGVRGSVHAALSVLQRRAHGVAHGGAGALEETSAPRGRLPHPPPHRPSAPASLRARQPRRVHLPVRAPHPDGGSPAPWCSGPGLTGLSP